MPVRETQREGREGETEKQIESQRYRGRERESDRKGD